MSLSEDQLTRKEDIRLSLRLTEYQLYVIALEYYWWRANRAGHPMKWNPSMTGMKIFFASFGTWRVLSQESQI